MGLNYDKIKSQIEDEGKQWASYSDLFMVLSVIFLLLYVTSSLRNGTFGIQKNIEYKMLKNKVEDLEQQLRVYNTLKEDYVEKGASTQEQKTYEELMGKLDLLQDEADEENVRLSKLAKENAEKEKALNQYQQLIRNIINSNMVAQSRIKKRDNIIIDKEKNIAKKQKEIQEKKEKIATLNSVVIEKEGIIENNASEIASMNNELERKISEIKRQRKRNKQSKKAMQNQIAKLKKQTNKKIAKLKTESNSIEKELQKTNKELKSAQVQISKAEQKIQLQKVERDKLAMNLIKSQEKYQEELDKVNDKFDAEMEKEKQKFERIINNERYSAVVRERKLKEYKEMVAQKEKEHEGRVSGLEDKVRSTSARLKATEMESVKFSKRVKELQVEKSKISSDLQKAKEKEKEYADYLKSVEKEKQELQRSLTQAKSVANAKKRLAATIKKNFKKAGIKADVDEKTGDVILAFGDEYFDTGKASLKSGMEDALQKFMPIYSDSLFSDATVAKKISEIEIIGFSSPTYGNKYVDPQSLDPADRKAVSYNLDLSYKRAKSIFKYIFNTKKFRYKNQKKVLPLTKVSGRSYLSENIKGRNLASGISRKEFCKKYNCRRAQRVIIKFNLED